MRCRRKAIGVDGGGVPFRSDLDQSLNAYIINENGSIVDSQSGLSAQLVEQPAGISVGAGTLTFSEDIDSVTSFGKAVAGTATINGGDAKQLDLSADTFWDIQLVVNGVAVRIPDPYTGYDINNNYHGTPANITEGTQDESAVIQSVGFNKYIKCLTNGTIRIKIEGAYTYRYYDLSTTTWSDESGTVTAGNYFELAIEAGDLAGLIKIGDVYPSQDVADWNIVSGSFENHLVPADMSAPTKDVLGNPLHYLPKGILPLGAIEFNPDDTAPTPAVLRLFDRDNIIGQTYEYWKTEIDDIASYDASHPERHSLTELTNGDYIRVLGTALLIQRLFLKGHKTDDDWTAISSIINYSAVLTATERQKVFNYLKDPSKSNQEAWEIYQDSIVVATYRFDQPLSLFNEDGELCKLGWEGEEILGAWATTAYWSLQADANWSDDTTKLISDGNNGWLKKNGPWVKDSKYKIIITVVRNSGTLNAPYDGSGTSITISTSGTYEYTYVPDSSSDMMLYSIAFNGEITALSIVEVGNTVAKVLDVGSGGVDGLTYYNLTQSDLSLQPKRVAGGIEFDGVDDRLRLPASLNIGKSHTITIRFKPYFDATVGSNGTMFYSEAGDSYPLRFYSGTLRYQTSTGGTTFFGPNANNTENEWTIVKIVRVGAAIEIFQDDVSLGSDTLSINADQFLYDIGDHRSGANAFNGIADYIKVEIT